MRSEFPLAVFLLLAPIFIVAGAAQAIVGRRYVDARLRLLRRISRGPAPAPARQVLIARIYGGTLAIASAGLLFVLHPHPFLARQTIAPGGDAIARLVEEAAAPLVGSGRTVGVGVGVVDSAGARVFGFGRARVDWPAPPAADTIVEIGSVTKVFTTLLLACLVEEGRVRLDQPVQDFLPRPVTMPRWRDRQILLEDLATHRSGLPRLPSNLGFSPLALIPALSDPYAAYDQARLYAFLSSYRLPRAPGATFEYSNLGMGLLGHALERASGEPYDALVRRLILEPLDMHDTSVEPSRPMVEHVAPGYMVASFWPTPWRAALPAHAWHTPLLAGAGALHSSAADMLKFLAVHAGLRPSPLSGLMDLTRRPRAATDRDDRVGLGWFTGVDASGRGPIVWHNGGTGGYRTFAGIVERRRTAVFIWANSTASVDAAGIRILRSLPP